jgi:hypothetical protein
MGSTAGRMRIGRDKFQKGDIAMDLNMDIPKIKKVLYESIFVRGYQERMVTKVYFRDGSAVTFIGSLDRKEACHQAFIQKGRDFGMTAEEAEVFADSKARV